MTVYLGAASPVLHLRDSRLWWGVDTERGWVNVGRGGYVKRVMAGCRDRAQGYPSEPTSLRQGGSRQGRLARGRSKLGGWPRFPGGADRTVFGLERAMSCW